MAASSPQLKSRPRPDQASTSPAPAPTPTTDTAAGAVAANAVSVPASTSAAAIPSGISRASLTGIPAARSTMVPQPAPTAARTIGNSTHAKISDMGRSEVALVSLRPGGRDGQALAGARLRDVH